MLPPVDTSEIILQISKLSHDANNSGFSRLLVVKSAEAAANPELRSIGLAFSTDGLSVTTDGDGNLAAIDPAGQKVFIAPAPRMWDSSTTATPTTARSATPSDGGPAPNGEFEPGHGARESVVPIQVADDQISLSPDQSLLTGEETKYPVYIDPAVTGAREAWTIFNGAGWDGATTPTARMGYREHDQRAGPLHVPHGHRPQVSPVAGSSSTPTVRVPRRPSSRPASPTARTAGRNRREKPVSTARSSSAMVASTM
ncbi:hypothetical protein SAMN02787144_1016135 [Streptomyces atratus]|uniref:Uncharacterized protein n=1 Tax=Streptomyces atratus TaxID=1893 RepID=A0A1K2E1H8_STRAR|nr:hypothetical protein SAMN02787144_1016135 [Streptomyces atratus]